MSLPPVAGEHTVVRIKRSVNLNLSTGATPGFHGFRIGVSLVSLPNSEEFTGFFERFRIRAATIKIITSAAHTPNVVGAGTCYIAADKTPKPSAPLFGDILQLQNLKIQGINATQPDITYTVKNPVHYLDGDVTAVTSNQQMGSTGYVSTQQGGIDTDWFGFTIGIDSPATVIENYPCVLTLDILLKGAK